VALALVLTVPVHASPIPSDESGQNRTATRTLTALQVFQRYSGAITVVEGYASVAASEPRTVGSGLLMTPADVVVTNAHVIAGAARVRIRLRFQSFVDDEVVLQYSDEAMDIAVLQLRTSAKISAPALRLSDRPPEIGSRVFAIGNPRGLERSISDGIVAGWRQLRGLGLVIQHTAPMSPGSSGGALFNDVGAVIGLTTAYLENGQNLNFAVPAAQVRAVMDQAADVPVIDDLQKLAALVDRTRERFPGQYDDMTPEAVLAMLLHRYPGMGEAFFRRYRPIPATAGR
jgi:S1-C subfamily serine protease